VIDALLYAVRDGIRASILGYKIAECEIMDDGRPPPRAGNYFAAVHGGRSRPGDANERNLYELFGFSVTLTMRVTVPLDRVGDQQIARNVPLTMNNVPLATRQGFNAKAEQLRAYLHSNWTITVLTGQDPNSANDNIIAWMSGTQYGFCEPARYQGMEGPVLKGGEWFGADPEAQDFGIATELRFDRAKRFQPQTAGTGVFA
jgi:hypothetical protein